MSYFQYGQDILQDVLHRAGEPITLSGAGASDYINQAKKYVQRAYYDILAYAPWPWALKDPPGILDVLKKKTNTATCTNGSTSVTLGTSISASVAGWWFEVDGEVVPYRIASHTGGTTAVTLDATYKEASVTLGACSIYKDEYDLASGCLKIWRAWNRNNPQEIVEIIYPNEMHNRFPFRSHSSISIARMTVVRDNKVRIKPWPEEDDITIEYEYTEKPTTDLAFDGGSSDIPVLPLNDRHLIADAALVMLYNEKNDQRASEIASLVSTKLNMMIRTYIAVGKARMYVRPGQGVWR